MVGQAIERWQTLLGGLLAMSLAPLLGWQLRTLGVARQRLDYWPNRWLARRPAKAVRVAVRAAAVEKAVVWDLSQLLWGAIRLAEASLSGPVVVELR